MAFRSQMKILLWKNLTILRRSYIRTAFIAILPFTVGCFILVIRNTITIITFPETTFNAFQPLAALDALTDRYNVIMYTPSDNIRIKTIMEQMQQFTSHALLFVGAESIQELKDLVSQDFENTFLFGVEFDRKYDGGIPLNFKQTICIRLPIYMRSFDSTYGWHNEEDFVYGNLLQQTEPDSYNEGSLAAIEMIWRSMMMAYLQQYTTGEPTEDIAYTMQGFSESETKYYQHHDLFVAVIQDMIIMCYLPCITYLMHVMSVEKEFGLKAYLQVAGLRRSAYWISWLVHGFIVCSICTVVLVIVLKLPFPVSILPLTNILLLAITLVFYSIAIVCMMFISAAFYDYSHTTMFISVLYFMLNQVPYYYLRIYKIRPVPVFLVSVFFPNTTICIIISTIMQSEIYDDGINFENVFLYSLESRGVSIPMLCLALSLGAALNLLLALYIDAVWPGRYGIRKNWNFFFTKKKKCMLFDRPPVEGEKFESLPRHAEVGVRIRDLVKVQGKAALLRNINIDFQKNKITAILGNNGAGKTTIFKILAGFTQATKGELYIHGYNLHTERQSVADIMGYCPNKVILIPTLSVYEHLVFMCYFKGMNYKETEKDINSFLRALNMRDLKYRKASELSTGIMKKFFLAMAFCGKPKVIIYEEISISLDNYSRFLIMNFLKSYKDKCTILFSTHIMACAAELADRIAILEQGNFISGGSMAFMNKIYGISYTILLDLLNDQVDIKRITDFLLKHLLFVKLVLSVGTHLVYVLPQDDGPVDLLLQNLEMQKEELSIVTFHVSRGDFEQVYFKATHITKDHAINPKAVDQNSYVRYTSGILKRNKLKALLLKRIKSGRHYWKFHSARVFLPLVYLLAIMHEYSNRIGGRTRISLDASMYRHVEVLLFSDGSQRAEDRLSNAFTVFSTLGFQCHILDDEEMGDYYRSLSHFDQTDIKFGIEYSAEQDKIYFNRNYKHVPMLALHSYFQAQMYHYNTEFWLDMQVDPLEQQMIKADDHRMQLVVYHFAQGFIVLMACVGTMTMYVYYFERTSSLKSLLMSMGVSPWMYYFANFLTDCLYYVITLTFITAILYFIDSDQVLVVIIGPLIVYAFVLMMNAYVFAYFMDISIKLLFDILSGILLSKMLIILIPTMLDKEDSVLYDICSFILSIIFPCFGCFRMVYEACTREWTSRYCRDRLESCMRYSSHRLEVQTMMQREQCENAICTETYYCCSSKYGEEFNWTGSDPPDIMSYIFVFIITALLYFIILCLLESDFSFKKTNHVPHEDPHSENESVREEKERIRSYQLILLKQPALVMKNLTKTYDRHRLIVNGLCFEVRRGECFFMSSANGAGSTTIVRMLTRRLKMSSGEVFYNGHNILTDIQGARGCFAYNVNPKTIMGKDTVQELLTFVFLLRGFRETDCPELTWFFAKMFGYHSLLKAMTNELSHGQIRRVCNSIPFIGNPRIILLDKPFQGYDLNGVHSLMVLIQESKKQGSTVVLFSSAVRNSFKLSDRLGILVNGQMQCIGSTAEVSKILLTGFNLLLHLEDVKDYDATRIAHVYISENFTSAILHRKTRTMMEYHIPHNTLEREDVERIVKDGKRLFPLKSFSISRPDIEGRYIDFCREQRF